MKKAVIIIVSTFVLIMFIYMIVVVSFDSLEKQSSFQAIADEAISNAGIEKTSWKTAVVASEIEVNASKQDVWSYWSDLERWPEWSDKLHQSAKFTSESKWTKESTFEQVLDLGPAGVVVGNEIVKFVDEGNKVMWWKNENGIRSCHIWIFESSGSNKTRVINLEVFDGNIIGLMKPLLIPDWQQKFDEGLKNLSDHFQKD